MSIHKIENCFLPLESKTTLWLKILAKATGAVLLARKGVNFALHLEEKSEVSSQLES